MSAAGPPQGAKCAPSGGSAAATVASVGAHQIAAGPPQGTKWPCRPRRCETQRLLVPSKPAQAGSEPRHSAPSGGSAAASAASVGVVK